MPATTVSLIMGGLFALFSAAPRILIEAMQFTPIQFGLFFAGTVMIVFAAGMLATKLAPRYGLDRSIRGGLWAAAAGGIAILLVSLYSPPFCRSSLPSACSCSAWASSIHWAPRRRSPRSATGRVLLPRWSASSR